MAPIVSAILTSYNKSHTIGQAIESVLAQTMGNWELFIMDDNSNEETVGIIKRYLNDPRIYYFNSNIQDSERYKKTRYATLINGALLKAKGKYITYLTDDNIFLSERFRVMVDVLKQNRQVEIVYSQQIVRFLDENGKMQYEITRNTKGILNKPAGLVDHCSIMHTREIADKIFRKHGGYWDDDPAYWFNGDAAFWNRLTKFNSFYPIPKTLDIAFKGPESFQKLYAHLPNSIPNGTLVKGPSSEIYIIDNQERRKISPEIFEKLKYDHNQVVKIPDPFLFKYKEGIFIDDQIFLNLTLLPNQRLIKSPEHPAVYYIQNNKKHLIKNEKAFRDFKFQWNQIVIVSDQLLAELPDGLPIEALSNEITILPDGVLFHDEFYYISLNNHLHPIEERVAVKLNLPVTNPVRIGSSFLTKFKQGEPFNWKIVF
ncbi:glycosyltransferase family 2 protein [Ectobacillus panaciterrae]|uniref:glycosyltransferase family 2 protein n=1 Tax=Ectobacillus panaciterrae TaxID=363872 RepID=UPI0004000A5C|nr:glycosyltransferase family 2 protein [Ectobacillus panaciterrae]